jgi:hypothetical protein
MKHRNKTVSALALLAVALTGIHASAQSSYTPYTFTTIAGNSGYGSADGTNRAARFALPYSVAVDGAGNMYVADMINNTIRKMTPAGTNWVVTTVAGLPGASGSADGTGSAARFNNPYGVAVDSAGNLYVADTGNDTIRKVTPEGTNWVVSTLAGSAGTPGDDDGIGSAARFYIPAGVAVDSAGNLYVADAMNDTIREVTLAGTNWVVTTLAGFAGSAGANDGTGSAAQFHGPAGVAVDSAGNVYVADTSNCTIRQMTPVGGNWVVTTLAGVAGSLGSADGTNSAARFHHPARVAVDSAGNVYVADTGNFTIRKATLAGTNWVVTTLAGVAGSSGTNDGTGSAARFNYPEAVAADSVGTVYVADSFNNTLRKLTPAGVVTTLAGLTTGGPGTVDGTGSAARFNSPHIAAVDSAGNIYVASGDNTIRKVTPVGPSWAVTTLAGQAGSSGTNDGTGSAARFNAPFEVALDSAGNLYVADAGNNTIRRLTPVGTNWVVTTLAGLAGSFGEGDGPGIAARFDGPAGVAVDRAGNVYVADNGNCTIRLVTPAGSVETLAGSRNHGSADGIGAAAEFNYPYDVALDNAGNLYVADYGNNTIRKVTLIGGRGWVVTTLGGRDRDGFRA